MLEDEIMTAEQVIEALGISRGTFYTRLREGLIPKPIDLGEHRKIWDRSVIENYIIDVANIKKSNAVVKDFLNKINDKKGDL
jgi:predicted DNA-binding transcriptional regulator AlpA